MNTDTMGLFDTIICEYPLPLPDFDDEERQDINNGDLGEINWKASEWQTKDFDNMLDVYTLEEDGQVYHRKTDWLEDENSPTGYTPSEGELEKYERTGEVVFYNFIMGKSYDHWLEFKATIWKGDLKEIELVEYKKEDNEERKKYVRQMTESMSEIAKDKGRRWYHPYSVYRFLLTKPLGLIRAILGFFIGATHRIERWLP